MSLVVVALVALGQIGQVSLYRSIATAPTGNNGYEEYLQAADIVRSTEFRSVHRVFLDTNRGASNYLAASKNLVLAAGAVPDLIEKGNTKPVSDPRKDLNWGSVHPELGSFRTIGRVLVAKANAEYADGKPKAATRSLLTCLKFAKNLMGVGDLIRLSTGRSAASLAMGALNEHLTRVPLADWTEVTKTCEEMLSVPALHSAFVEEFRRFESGLKVMIDGSDPDPFGFADSEPGRSKIYADTRRLPPADRAGLQKRVLDFARTTTGECLKTLSGPERSWESSMGALAETRSAQKDPLVSFWAGFQLLSGSDDDVRNELVLRTRLKLLMLHAQIQRQRWEDGKLPASLGSLPDQQKTIDPATGRAFLYRVEGQRYELYSQGAMGTGRIDLVYFRGKEARDEDSEQPIKP